jgi:parallel beta-helix repeat protein
LQKEKARMKRALSAFMLVLLLVSMLTLAFKIQPVRAEPRTWTVDDDGPADFSKMQDAINAANSGDTIYVYNGTYYESIVVNKTLLLIGENRAATIIDANGTGNVVVIQADNSTAEGFTIRNGGFGVAIMGNSTNRYTGNVVAGNTFINDADAIALSTCDKNTVANNTFENNGFNIIVGWINPLASWDVTSNNNTIVRNNVTQGLEGIIILNSTDNIVSENNVSNITDKGITFLMSALSYYPFTPVVTNNSICNNVIVNCTSGLSLSGQDSYGYETQGPGSCNNITENVIQNNELGLYINDVGNNTIMGNTIANNVFGMYLDSENNLLRANVMFENMYNFVGIWAALPARPVHNDIDTSNTVNGKSIYHLFNETNLNINPSTHPDMGYLALTNCSNVRVEDMNFSNNGFGIALEGCNNITITRTTIQDNVFAISAYGYSVEIGNITISNNIIKNNLHGISAMSCEHVTVENNLIANNTVRRILQIVKPYSLQTMHRSIRGLIYSDVGYVPLCYFSGGIFFLGVENSTVVDNMIVSNERGIFLYICTSNVFKNNTMKDNVYNFEIEHTRIFPPIWGLPGRLPDPPQISPYLMNDVDTSNTVDGKPVYWWINRQDEQVPKGAGYLVLVNSTNMIIKDLVLHNNGQDMLLVGVSNSLISNNSVTDARYGIYLLPHTNVNPSTNNTITQNNMTRNGLGILIASQNSLVSGNLLTGNLGGICDSYGNITITGNLVMDSRFPPREEWLFGDYPFQLYGVGQVAGYISEGVGIILLSGNTTVYCNTIQNNYYGIAVGVYAPYGGNEIFHNNFINNAKHVWQRAWALPNSTWDDGYPSGGNYWSDYEERYSDASEVDGSGIWDTPYLVDENNQDNYPLMNPYGSARATAATVDIDPDTLNLKSQGKWITASIELPEGYDVADINVSTMLSNGTVPVDPNAPTAIGDYDGDGIPDLMVKFNRTAVSNLILSQGIMTGNVTLTITGQLHDGTVFKGSAVIAARMPGDINSDGKVDAKDIALVSSAFGSYPGHPRWKLIADENEDGKIDVRDVSLIARNFGKTYT